MGWTQPICAVCWNDKNPDRPAVTVALGPEETCCYCGITHFSGIYVRVDPKTVPHPSEDE